jgi:hypothetical protein
MSSFAGKGLGLSELKVVWWIKLQSFSEKHNPQFTEDHVYVSKYSVRQLILRKLPHNNVGLGH